MDEAVDEDVRQSDLVHERLRESPIRRWVLLDGNRYVLAILLSLVVFVSCTVIGLAGYIPVTDSDTATTLIGSIVGGTLPFITIVLAINQLVLSQELGWTGDLQDRFEQMLAFRRQVEELTASQISPASPADFLQLIVETVVEHGGTFRSETDHVDDPELDALIEDFVEAIESEGEIVSDALEDADFGTFDALSAVLGHYNGAHLHAARTIRAVYGEDIPADALETLDGLVELLSHLAVARQTFKTLYMQYELAYLSKLLLYVGFPTLLGGGIFMMTYGSIIEAVAEPIPLVFIVSTAVTLVFLPFVVLLVYTFRIATIASRTADFGPFVPRVDIDG
ncbi:hypothetical protein HUG10_04385 [Halorarum halophilum]|uniref:Uncharacterized protein n=1 Tax=Halorarum halophilum TaxID=2743090 RepID=A0A7D5L2M5_9EURY|nr:hypothetical protein [Halobaculum halophilum]QLG26823.1 hypothetical protein HUG10_04385 [Halobaculum halophilum]